jgi:hypothetical protein
MQEETMKNRMIFSSMGVLAVGALAVTFIVSPAPAQTAINQPTAAAPAKKKPTSATPQMIDEAVQRTNARAAKAAATGRPEQFGSEEPFTYVPGRTF